MFTLSLLWVFVLANEFDYGLSTTVPFSHQTHIALNPDNQLAISWVTYSPYANNEPPVLYLTEKQPSTNNIANSSVMIKGYTLPNTVNSRYYHHCITTPLIPNQKYYYQPGKNASIFSFFAPNPSLTSSTTTTKSQKLKSISKSNQNVDDNDNEPLVTFLAYGDLGVTNSHDTIELLNSMTQINSTNYTNIDFIAHFGDISYADDRDEYDYNPEYIPVYDEWGDLLQPIFSHIPYMVTPGNHEMSCHSWTDLMCQESIRNFSTYRHYFSMPLVSEFENMWYSFDFKNIHFLMINTESDYLGSPCVASHHRDIVYPECGPFGDQREWVKQDLEQASQNPDISWIIAMGHRPFYSSSHQADHVDFPPLTSTHLRESFEKLFHDYKVDLYLSGHIHAYERLYPTYKDEIVSKNYTKPPATVGITNGAAGCIEGHQIHGWKDLREYTALYNDQDWGIGIVRVYNDTVLNWQFVSSQDGSIKDEIWLERDTNPWN